MAIKREKERETPHHGAALWPWSPPAKGSTCFLDAFLIPSLAYGRLRSDLLPVNARGLRRRHACRRLPELNRPQNSRARAWPGAGPARPVWAAAVQQRDAIADGADPPPPAEVGSAAVTLVGTGLRRLLKGSTRSLRASVLGSERPERTAAASADDRCRRGQRPHPPGDRQ